jgi:hypothetical protein
MFNILELPLQATMSPSHHIFFHGTVVPMERTVQSCVAQSQVLSVVSGGEKESYRTGNLELLAASPPRTDATEAW